jgi:hypothetical protein
MKHPGRLRALFFLCGLLWFSSPTPFPVRAQSPSRTLPASERAAPVEIKAQLDRIFTAREFRPAQSGDRNPLQKYLQQIKNAWDRFWKWYRDLFSFSRLGAGGEIFLTWLFLLGFLSLSLWLLFKIFTNRFARKKRLAEARTVLDTEEWSEEEIPAPEDLLQNASLCAQQGDYRGAYRALFLATLLRLDRNGLIPFERAVPNGAYLHALYKQGRKELFDLLRPFVWDFDTRWYGAHPTSEADYQEAQQRYQAIASALQNARETTIITNGSLAPSGEQR